MTLGRVQEEVRLALSTGTDIRRADGTLAIAQLAGGAHWAVTHVALGLADLALQESSARTSQAFIRFAGRACGARLITSQSYSDA